MLEWLATKWAVFVTAVVALTVVVVISDFVLVRYIVRSEMYRMLDHIHRHSGAVDAIEVLKFAGKL
jgi:hypothetical protein